MSWKERFSSKANRSSWKTAHEDAHPHVEDTDDLQSHLTSHHQGDFIGDVDDHEWFHTDPDNYIEYHRGVLFPIEYHNPDHYHSNDYGNSTVPDSLPPSFASLEKLAHEDIHPWPTSHGELASHLGSHHHHLIDHDAKAFAVSPSEILEGVASGYSTNGFDMHIALHKDAALKRRFPHTHPHEHDDEDLGNLVPENIENFLLTTVSSVKTADPGSLRDEGVPSFTEPSYQDDQDDDDQVVGPQDLDSNATNVDKFPKSVGVFKNSSWATRTAAGGSEFGNPIDYNENRMQSLQAPGLEIRTPLDTGKRNYSEQRQDANPLTLRSWFTGDDVNGPWPHTKNLSGPLDFEPTDNQNEDSTGPVTSSFNSKNAHFHGVTHPWPTTPRQYVEHVLSHHPDITYYIHNKSRQIANAELNDMLSGASDETLHKSLAKPCSSACHNTKLEHNLEFHAKIHRGQSPSFNSKGDHAHEHDDELNIDLPEDVEEITPQYVTSSWHQSFVETVPTNSDEELPNTLLNPADELKNGRPRANDLPQQQNQLIPGMLIDHDQMGGSGTDTGSF